MIVFLLAAENRASTCKETPGESELAEMTEPTPAFEEWCDAGDDRSVLRAAPSRSTLDALDGDNEIAVKSTPVDPRPILREVPSAL